MDLWAITSPSLRDLLIRPVRLGSQEVIVQVQGLHYTRLSSQSSLPQMRVALTHGWQVERRNEIVLHKLGEPGDLLVFLLHDLDVLSELNDALAVRLIMLFPASCLAARIRPWCGGLSKADKIAAKAALPLSIVKGAAYMSLYLKLL